jgi:ribosomal protein S17E
MDITEEFDEYFTNTFPKALEKVKELAEESS